MCHVNKEVGEVNGVVGVGLLRCRPHTFLAKSWRKISWAIFTSPHRLPSINFAERRWPGF